MAKLDSLPPELLIIILQYLNVFDREALAKTFNRSLYFVSRPWLDIPWTGNARRMVERFYQSYSNSIYCDTSAFPHDLPPFLPVPLSPPSTVMQKLDLDPEYKTYIYSSPPDLRSWMRLDGSFDWLVGSIHPDIEDARVPRALLNREAMDYLLSQTKKLGLVLPMGFEKFVLDDKLHRKILHGDWWFDIGPLVKCPASVDKGAGGYLLRFHCEDQCCAFASLYLDEKGGHCVVSSQHDPPFYDTDAPYSWNRWNYTGIEPEENVHSYNNDESVETSMDERFFKENWGLTDRYFKTANRVVSDGRITQDELDAATKAGIQVAMRIQEKPELLAFTFEEYLATHFFQRYVTQEFRDLPYYPKFPKDPNMIENIKKFASHVFIPPRRFRSRKRPGYSQFWTDNAACKVRYIQE